MAQQFSDKSEALLTQKAQQKISMRRSQTNQKWLHIDGLGYKISTVLIWISGIYNIVVFLSQFMGFWLKVISNEDNYRGDMRNAGICCLLIASAIVLMALKKKFASSVASIAFVLFYGANVTLKSTAIDGQTTFRFIFIPSSLIMLLAAAFIFVTVICDKVELKRAKDAIIEKIIRQHTSSNGEVTTEAQWQQYIDEYINPVTPEKQKKSIRVRSQKARQKQIREKELAENLASRAEESELEEKASRVKHPKAEK